MTRQTLRNLAVASVLAVIVALTPVLLYGFLWWIPFHRWESRLRDKTDHRSLLSACQAVIAREARSVSQTTGGRSWVAPEALPLPLHHLGARGALVADQSVYVELGGAGLSYGLIAVAQAADDDARRDLPHAQRCEVLIPKLWYCTE